MIHTTIEATCEAWLPTDPPRPAPLLLTEEEAILFLRLDKVSPTPERTLKHHRDCGNLKSIRIGKKLTYRLADLKKFIEDMATNQN